MKSCCHTLSEVLVGVLVTSSAYSLSNFGMSRKKDPLLSCTDDGGKTNQTGERDPANRNSHCAVIPSLTWPGSPLLKRCVWVQRV